MRTPNEIDSCTANVYIRVKGNLYKRQTPDQAMADDLWDQLQRTLLREGLSYKDLPKTEALLFGTLEDLGFTNLLDRVKLNKMIT